MIEQKDSTEIIWAVGRLRKLAQNDYVKARKNPATEDRQEERLSSVNKTYTWLNKHIRI